MRRLSPDLLGSRLPFHGHRGARSAGRLLTLWPTALDEKIGLLTYTEDSAEADLRKFAGLAFPSPGLFAGTDIRSWETIQQ
jgi:hypothetical protein